MKDKVIDGLKKDNEDLRGVVKDKDDTIRLMTRQLMEGKTRVETLEADLVFAKTLADLHKKSFEMAIGITRRGLIATGTLPSDPDAPCP